MNSAQVHPTISEAEYLRIENENLKQRLARLSEASIKVSDNLDTESVLQEVINNA